MSRRLDLAGLWYALSVDFHDVFGQPRLRAGDGELKLWLNLLHFGDNVLRMLGWRERWRFETAVLLDWLPSCF
jgi:hypothetical protein